MENDALFLLVKVRISVTPPPSNIYLRLNVGRK